MRVKASLWIRTETSAGEHLALEWTSDDPVTTTEWTVREATVEVIHDVDLVNIGVIVEGGGNAWLDDVSLQVVR